MTPLLAAALLFAAQDDPCPPDPFANSSSYDRPGPVEPSGTGLWIGGIAFLPADVESAAAIQDSLTESWAIEITLTPPGKAKFDRMQRCRLGLAIEISLDRKLLSRPRLHEPILGKAMMILGDFTQESAAAVAARIKPAD